MQPCKLRRSRKPCWRSARPRTAATLARSARHRANPQVKLNDHIGLWFCDRHIATARPNLWSLLAIPSPRDDVVARRQVRRNLHLPLARTAVRHMCNSSQHGHLVGNVGHHHIPPCKQGLGASSTSNQVGVFPLTHGLHCKLCGSLYWIHAEAKTRQQISSAHARNIPP